MQPTEEQIKHALAALIIKRTALKRHGAEIETLALGNSHGEYAFDSDKIDASFNLCSPSQDIKYSALLLDKVLPLCPNLRNIVLFYSVFSPGWSLDRSPSQKYWGVALDEVFELGVSFEDEEQQSLSGLVKGLTLDLKQDFGKCGYPPALQSFFPAEYGVERRVGEHLKYNLSEEQIPYLHHIFALARHAGKNLYVVTPPARSDYRKEAGGSFGFLFRSLQDAVKRVAPFFKVTMVNMYGFPLFSDELFGDYDHLHPDGLGPSLVAKILKTTFTQNK